MVYIGSYLDARVGCAGLTRSLVSRGIDFGFVREREEFTPYESLGGLEGIGLGNALLRARLTAVREVDCTTDYMSTGGQKVLRYFGTKDRGSRFFAKTLTRFSSSWFENFGAVAIQKIPSPGPTCHFNPGFVGVMGGHFKSPIQLQISQERKR